MTAMYGTNFCISAKDAFLLLLKHCLRVAVLTKVTEFVVFLSKLAIMALTIGMAYGVFT